MDNNLTKFVFDISKNNRILKFNQKPKLIWFTGLSGSGKSTLANALERILFDEGFSTYTLDGDNVRNGISSDLNFSQSDRSENIRRIAEIANLFLDAGIIVCSSFISPLERDRELVKSIVGTSNFIEIYVSTSLEKCEKRDTKGLYKKARAGKILNFTGISSEYEVPKNPNLVVDTSNDSIQNSVNCVYNYVKNQIKY